MTVYRAAWVLPITAPPIRDGWVGVDGGRITDVGGTARSDALDLGNVALLPALVNAHTHLELSYLADAVPPSTGFVRWARQIIAARGRMANPADPVIVDAARQAIDHVAQTGTGLVGDVSNSLVTIPLLRDAGMPACVFHELLGFNVADPTGRVRQARTGADAAAAHDERVRVSLAPHAPYSVSPALFDAIRADLEVHASDVSSVHLGESPDEVEFLARGTGEFRTLLSDLGAWTDAWHPPASSPAAYLDGLGLLGTRMLVVHAVQSSDEDLALIKRRGATIVVCPRSNRHVGVGSPPLAAFHASGVTVAIGTDSLASAPDLNVFSELAEARRIAPAVPARWLLACSTLQGAAALGFEKDRGSLEPGKEAALITVRTPAGIDDVEEYLVGGVVPDAIRWVT